MKTLKDFLAEKSEALRGEASQADQIRREWEASYWRLLEQMKAWLVEADTEQILRIVEGTDFIREVGIGEYLAYSLLIDVGLRQVKAVPVARFVAGPHSLNGLVAIKRAFGRVDLTNGAERYMIIRIEKEPEDLWSIIEQDSYRMEPFDRESFERAMQSLLE